MTLKAVLTISLMSLAIASCTTETTTSNPPAESPAAVSPAASPAASAESQSTQATAPAGAKTGSFVSGEHPTQGTVSIVTKDGKSFIELDQAFKTSEMGPDLVVALHKSDNVIGSTQPPAYALKEGDYVVIEELKKPNGAQSYAVPASVNLADYQSVVIWCRKFNATFGAAKLSS